MLIDMHAHTSAISPCCERTAEEVFAEAQERGIDGLVICNHYESSYFNEDTYQVWIERYIEEVEHCKQIAKEKGMKCFFGAEITMDYKKPLHFLIYGSDADFLRKYPYLCKMTQKKLCSVCNEYGAALVQAHPFRHKVGIQNTRYLHGLEINCHPLYLDSFAENVVKMANKKGLAITVGCDYHGDTYRPSAGSFLPDEIRTEQDLASYIRNNQVFEMQIHEPKNGEIYRYQFTRK